MGNVKSPALFYGVSAIAVVALLLCIYAIIPGINHVFIPAYANPTQVHFKYVAVFGVLAVLGVVGAIITRPKAAAK